MAADHTGPGTPEGLAGRATAPRIFAATGLAATGAFLVLRGAPAAQAWLFLSMFAASTAAIALGVRRHGPSRRSAWRILLASQGVYLAALVGWYLYPVVWGGSLPYPSFLDVLFWSAYVGWGAFLLLLSRTGERVNRGVWLDSVIVAIAVGCAGWYFLLDPIVDDRDLAVPVRVASSVYVLLVVALAVLALRVMLTRGQPRIGGALLLGWVAAELGGDVVYSLTSAAGTFRYGAPWFTLWMVSYALIGALALHPDMALLGTRVGGRDARVTGGGALILLGLSTVAPLLITVTEALEGHRAEIAVFLGLTVLTVGLVLLRLRLLGTDLERERRLRAELARVTEQLRHASRHDALTGLLNRAAFDEALAHATTRRPVGGRGPALLLVDLDSFKAVNDTYGHHVGDLLLQATAERLRGGVRPEDVVARLGGDEFAVLLEQADAGTALALARRLADLIVEPVRAGEDRVRPGASLGLHVLTPGEDANDALVRADTALYTAKDVGGGVELFDEKRHSRFVERHRVETELRAAVRDEQLVVHYQPVLDLSSRRVVAVEALVRWRHPRRGLLEPEDFLDVAEGSGLVVDLGRWVLRTACTDAARWRAEVPRAADVGVAVNVARRQLDHGDFVDEVLDVLHLADLAPQALTLEVTESAFVRDVAALTELLHKLRQLGPVVAMDDFGTGHASLAQLRTLPVDVLKVDKVFVESVTSAPQEWALVAAILELAASLGKRTVAEGIESQSQLDQLVMLGANLGQGRLFAAPMPVEELMAWLAGSQPGRG